MRFFILSGVPTFKTSSLFEEETSNLAEADTRPIPTLFEALWIKIIDSFEVPSINCTFSVLPTVCNLIEPVVSNPSPVKNIDPDEGTILTFLAIYFFLK